MKKYIFIFGITFFAAALLVCCKECDKHDPTSDCYVVDPFFDYGVVLNGIKWATRNVDSPGTFAPAPESAGKFYQWNRKVGWSAHDPLSNTSGGKEWDSTVPEGNKWNEANDPCPAGWRVPTIDELETLEDIIHDWTTINGVDGEIFIDNLSGGTMFLPAAGSRYSHGGLSGFAGVDGRYWSSTRYNGTNAHYLDFYSSGLYTFNYERNSGLSVRCVAE